MARWILGATDPEMERIESLLRQLGEQVEHAMVNGTRVHPGNAYKADPPTGEGQFYFVECSFHSDLPKNWVLVDHHWPGDPGYGKSHWDFLQGSSIGQVIYHLARLYPDFPARVGWGPPDLREYDSDQEPTFIYRRWRWKLAVDGKTYFIPLDIIYAAAADHCLAAAYRGKCPGVDPGELLNWRVASRAAFQRRNPEEILRDIQLAREALKKAPVLILGGVEVKDMRGPVVPELVEAAQYEGLAYIAGPLEEKNGRFKVVLSGPPEAVQAFLAGEGPAKGLLDHYGSPSRGFAGGYMPDDRPCNCGSGESWVNCPANSSYCG